MPLWNEKICTLSDFYRKRFGKKIEIFSVFVSIPTFIGWIAVQLISLAHIMELTYGLPINTGIALVAVFAAVYTYLGGMWSVTLTDALQLVFVGVGLIVLFFSVFGGYDESGAFHGLAKVISQTDPERLVIVPTKSLPEFFNWIGLFLVASIGNIPSQDLAQRIFSAKSVRVAKTSCLIAGVLYLIIGTLPVMLGLLAHQILPPEITKSVIPALADRFLAFPLNLIFFLAVVSVILSTIDSAILAPASTLARNGLRHLFSEKSVPTILLLHVSVVLITGASMVTAYIGEDAYSLLQASYGLGLAGLMLPLSTALFTENPDVTAVGMGMFIGVLLWSPEFFGYEELPYSLLGFISGFVVFVSIHRLRVGSFPRIRQNST